MGEVTKFELNNTDSVDKDLSRRDELVLSVARDMRAQAEIYGYVTPELTAEDMHTVRGEYGEF